MTTKDTNKNWYVCLADMHECSPHNANLKLKGVNIAGFCPLCEKVPENLPHALLQCEHEKQT